MAQDDQSSERRHFPPVREGYDRPAVDAYLGDLAVEMEALTRASGALHERVRALGGELQALTASLQAGTQAPPAAVTGQPTAAAAGEPEPVESPRGVAAERTPPATLAMAPGREDLDGARLVALNMALEGQPRERTDDYLAERFRLEDRAKLLDEVYAALDR